MLSKYHRGQRGAPGVRYNSSISTLFHAVHLRKKGGMYIRKGGARGHRGRESEREREGLKSRGEREGRKAREKGTREEGDFPRREIRGRRISEAAFFFVFVDTHSSPNAPLHPHTHTQRQAISPSRSLANAMEARARERKRSKGRGVQAGVGRMKTSFLRERLGRDTANSRSLTRTRRGGEEEDGEGGRRPPLSRRRTKGIDARALHLVCTCGDVAAPRATKSPPAPATHTSSAPRRHYTYPLSVCTVYGAQRASGRGFAKVPSCVLRI